MRDTILTALSWMLIDGLASAIDVVPLFANSGGIGAIITVTANGVPTIFDYAWSAFR